MKTTIQKWGNSLGVRIPSHIAKDLSLESGSPVEILEEETRIVILPKTKKRLKDIIALITNDNIHQEAFDRRAGNETL
jgi:antitoxin MazE